VIWCAHFDIKDLSLIREQFFLLLWFFQQVLCNKFTKKYNLNSCYTYRNDIHTVNIFFFNHKNNLNIYLEIQSKLLTVKVFSLTDINLWGVRKADSCKQSHVLFLYRFMERVKGNKLSWKRNRTRKSQTKWPEYRK